jgi:hypothetical protein
MASPPIEWPNEREPLRADVVDHGENIVAERREVPFVAAEP